MPDRRDQPAANEREPVQHRSERMRKAFGFSRFQWYVIAPIEYWIRYLLWKVRRV